jgi:hypothetical protein
MIDFKLTDIGDLSLSSERELEFSQNDALNLQYALARVKSAKNDWYIDNVGADLERLIGEPLNEQLIEQGKQMIMDALTEYNLFKISEIYIQHREDVEEDQLSYYVYLRMSSMERSQVLSVSLSPMVSVNVL